jgi:Spy/CpxP family protein refolding chaperone
MSVSPTISLAIASLLLNLAATPATAQGPGYGPGGPPSGGPPGGGPPGGRRGPQFDLLALEGPPTPADFTRVTGATTEQQAQYSMHYDAYRRETKATRDSAQLAQQNIRAAFDHGRREAVPPLFATLNETGKTLDAKLKAFDEQVKKLLPKDQWKKYQKDEKERRKALEEERKEMMPPGGPPGGPGGHGPP